MLDLLASVSMGDSLTREVSEDVTCDDVIKSY